MIIQGAEIVLLPLGQQKRDRLLHETDRKHPLMTDKHTETFDCVS